MTMSDRVAMCLAGLMATTALAIAPTFAPAATDMAQDTVRTANGQYLLRFGLISDVHLGALKDENKRLGEFVQRMTEKKVDFIVQLGDFCHVTKPNAKAFIAIWNNFPEARYHVLGNHDMDLTSKQTVVEALGMKAPHYSFDAGDFHGVVLDPNFIKDGDQYIAYDTGNQKHKHFRAHGSYVPPEQIEWLRRDLTATNRQVIVFSHQDLGHPGVANQTEVRAVLEDANRQAGFPKVVACFAGHLHEDCCCQINGIHYVQINSASYSWLGSKYGRLIAYKDPLYALVTITPDGIIQIQGRQSVLLPPTLDERGAPPAVQARVRASITDRTLRYVPHTPALVKPAAKARARAKAREPTSRAGASPAAL